MLDKAKPTLDSLGLSSPFISPLDLCYVTWYLHSFRPQRMRQVEQIGLGNGYLMTLGETCSPGMQTWGRGGEGQEDADCP